MAVAKQQQQRTLITEQWNNLERFWKSFSRERSWHQEQQSDDCATRNSKEKDNGLKSQLFLVLGQHLLWEFDPGSGWTLAACLTHASRTKHPHGFSSELKWSWLSGGRGSNAWGTCPIQGDNSRKRLLIPHKRTVPHGTVWKTPVVWDGPASD